jgi:hypothetical protein
MISVADDRLRGCVMRRVYLLWAGRQVTSPFFIKMFTLAVLAYGLHKYASIKDVLHNSPSFFDIGSTTRFFESAFIRTDAVTQVLSVGIAGIILVIARDAYKKTSLANRYEALNAIWG